MAELIKSKQDIDSFAQILALSCARQSFFLNLLVTSIRASRASAHTVFAVMRGPHRDSMFHVDPFDERAPNNRPWREVDDLQKISGKVVVMS